MQAPVTSGDEVQIDDATTIRSSAKPVATSLMVVVMLSLDELNPVKVFCSYTYGLLSEWHVACISAILLVGLAINLRQHLLYYAGTVFFRCTFNNLFFHSIEIVGMEHLPKDGPVIVTGNHNNQFVDGVILLANCHREMSFMIAEKSMRRPLVGFLARVFHCFPVARPQDKAFAGAGTVSSDGSAVLRGSSEALFASQVEPGSQLEIQGRPQPVKVAEVVSNTELRLAEEVGEGVQGSAYRVLPKADHSVMYEKVYAGLKMGKCLGIFPEGGSHDRTDLLPLKAGVAVIALNAFTHHSIAVPIVPVGLNYFSGHRFGGRVVVEFGAPINIPESLHALHETDRRAATDQLLSHIASGMRGVIVPVPDYHTLQQIYMLRRLYVHDGLKLSAEKSMDINRRFAVAAHRILQQANHQHASRQKDREDSMDSSFSLSRNASIDSEASAFEPKDDRELQKLSKEDKRRIHDLVMELEDYMETLKQLGLRDHQVRQIGWWSAADLIGRLLYLVVTMSLGAIPQLMFNLPVMLIASKLAVTEQHKSLKASNVKLAARDVVMSSKIIFVLMCVPLMYLVYGTLMLRYSGWSPTTLVLALVVLPLFSFFGTKASEQGVRALRDVEPLFMRLFPGPRRKQNAMPARRAALQRRLHSMVKTFGPRLGDLYWQKDVDWGKEMGDLVRSESDQPQSWRTWSRRMSDPLEWIMGSPRTSPPRSPTQPRRRLPSGGEAE